MFDRNHHSSADGLLCMAQTLRGMAESCLYEGVGGGGKAVDLFFRMRHACKKRDSSQ